MALRVKSFEAVQTASTDLNTAAQKYATTLQEIRDLVNKNTHNILKKILKK